MKKKMWSPRIVGLLSGLVVCLAISAAIVAAIPKDITRSWKTYENPVQHFSFKYPQSDNYVVRAADALSENPEEFGSILVNTDSKGGPLFNVQVIYTPKWSTIGNAYGDVDALEKGFKENGVEEVAKISREINLQKEKNFSKKAVSGVKTYSYGNGTGYGFTVTSTFKECFNTERACGSGWAIQNAEIHAVYVTNGSDIYLITFPVDSAGEQIFSTFKMAE